MTLKRYLTIIFYRLNKKEKKEVLVFYVSNTDTVAVVETPLPTVTSLLLKLIVSPIVTDRLTLRREHSLLVGLAVVTVHVKGVVTAFFNTVTFQPLVLAPIV